MKLLALLITLVVATTAVPLGKSVDRYLTSAFYSNLHARPPSTLGMETPLYSNLHARPPVVDLASTVQPSMAAADPIQKTIDKYLTSAFYSNLHARPPTTLGMETPLYSNLHARPPGIGLTSDDQSSTATADSSIEKNIDRYLTTAFYSNLHARPPTTLGQETPLYSNLHARPPTVGLAGEVQPPTAMLYPAFEALGLDEKDNRNDIEDTEDDYKDRVYGFQDFVKDRGEDKVDTEFQLDENVGEESEDNSNEVKEGNEEEDEEEEEEEEEDEEKIKEEGSEESKAKPDIKKVFVGTLGNYYGILSMPLAASTTTSQITSAQTKPIAITSHQAFGTISTGTSHVPIYTLGIPTTGLVTPTTASSPSLSSPLISGIYLPQQTSAVEKIDGQQNKTATTQSVPLVVYYSRYPNYKPPPSKPHDTIGYPIYISPISWTSG